MVEGIFKKRRTTTSYIILVCSIFLIAFFVYQWHIDSTAATGIMLLKIAFAGIFCFFSVFFLLFNRKAFLRVESDKISGRCGWFCRFSLDFSDIVHLSAAHNTLTLTLNSGKQIWIGGLENPDAIYYAVCRKIPFRSKKEIAQVKEELFSAKRKQHKGNQFLIGSAVWIIAVIIVTILLTDGRDIPDFTRADWMTFYSMCLVLTISFVFIFVAASKIGKIVNSLDNKIYAVQRTVIESAPLLPGNVVRVTTNDFYTARFTVFGYPNSDSIYYTAEEFDDNYNLILVFTSEIFESIAVLEEDLDDMIDITALVPVIP